MVDIQRISSSIGLSREYIYIYLDYLQKAGILLGLKRGQVGYKAIRKPEKLYINNSNLYLSIIKEEVNANNIGNVRETFAANQLSSIHKVTVPDNPEAGDFIVGNTTIEVGGPHKGIGIQSVAEKKFLFLDNIEIGNRDTIPLYLLGFLY